MTILEHVLVKTARQLAKDRVLYDPTDEEIVCAVQDYLRPNEELPLTDYLQRLIVREYDAYTS